MLDAMGQWPLFGFYASAVLFVAVGVLFLRHFGRPHVTCDLYPHDHHDGRDEFLFVIRSWEPERLSDRLHVRVSAPALEEVRVIGGTYVKRAPEVVCSGGLDGHEWVLEFALDGLAPSGLVLVRATTLGGPPPRCVPHDWPVAPRGFSVSNGEWRSRLLLIATGGAALLLPVHATTACLTLAFPYWWERLGDTGVAEWWWLAELAAAGVGIALASLFEWLTVTRPQPSGVFGYLGWRSEGRVWRKPLDVG